MIPFFILAGCSSNKLPTATSLPTALPVENAAPSQERVPTTTTVIGKEDGLEVDRGLLTYDELIVGFEATSPVDDSALALPEDVEPPDHVFEGRLELFAEDTGGGIELIKGDLDSEPKAHHIPEFNFQFVQSGGYLIPVQRGLIITDHPYWNYFLEPGRVWKESSDGGYSRASFPFALTWKRGNAIFNGVMTFLFDEESVSKVWYQITQETCWSLKADFWGLLEAAYHREPVPGANQIRVNFDQELTNRFPTKPIAQLAEDYPGVDISMFGKGITSKHMTTYGFVINGVDYVSGCSTRYGEYAYCEYMRTPSYSTAKSIFASVALMRLAQKFDPEVPDFLIKDYVPEYENSPGDWSTVTFDHTLDMATGNYKSAKFMEDEDSRKTGDFWSTDYYGEKITAAFDWPHSANPGTQWVYRTFDTFILTRAMQNYLQTQEDPEADIYEFLVEEVFKPINIGPGAYTSQRTKDDNWQGQVLGGYGLWWIHDDIAKIAAFLNNDSGMVNGEQILHPDMLASTLQQNPADRGVDIDSGWKYNNAFWAQEFTSKNGYECEFWIPHMSGYSGITIALMPNGTTYYYSSDNREFTWFYAVKESNRLIPHCP
jgi:hypothetical protein